MKYCYLVALLLTFNFINAQTVDPPVQIQPVGATGDDEITVVVDVNQQCVGTLGSPGSEFIEGEQMYMHAGIGTVPELDGNDPGARGEAWNYVVPAIENDIPNPDTEMTYEGNGIYSISFVPREFFGVPPGVDITRLCMVFTSGATWEHVLKGQGYYDGQQWHPDWCGDIFVEFDEYKGVGPYFNIDPNYADSVNLSSHDTTFTDSPNDTTIVEQENNQQPDSLWFLNNKYAQDFEHVDTDSWGYSAAGNLELDISNGAYRIISDGHIEWAYADIYLGSPQAIALTTDDTIRFQISAIPDLLRDVQPVITAYVIDESGVGNFNQLTNDEVFTVSAEESIIEVPIRDFEDVHMISGVVDSNKITFLRLGINFGYASFPVVNDFGDTLDFPYTGTITIESVHIGNGPINCPWRETGISQIVCSGESLSIDEAISNLPIGQEIIDTYQNGLIQGDVIQFPEQGDGTFDFQVVATGSGCDMDTLGLQYSISIPLDAGEDVLDTACSEEFEIEFLAHLEGREEGGLEFLTTLPDTNEYPAGDYEAYYIVESVCTSDTALMQFYVTGNCDSLSTQDSTDTTQVDGGTEVIDPLMFKHNFYAQDFENVTTEQKSFWENTDYSSMQVMVSDGQFQIHSLGHNEWDFIDLAFDDPIFLSTMDTIRMTIWATPDLETGIQPTLFVATMDINGVGANNELTLNERITIPDTKSVIDIPIVSFYDTWGSGLYMDSTSIIQLRLNPNQGWASFPHSNWNGDSIKAPYFGTIYIESVYIGRGQNECPCCFTLIEDDICPSVALSVDDAIADLPVPGVVFDKFETGLLKNDTIHFNLAKTDTVQFGYVINSVGCSQDTVLLNYSFRSTAVAGEDITDTLCVSSFWDDLGQILATKETGNLIWDAEQPDMMDVKPGDYNGMYTVTTDCATDTALVNIHAFGAPFQPLVSSNGVDFVKASIVYLQPNDTLWFSADQQDVTWRVWNQQELEMFVFSNEGYYLFHAQKTIEEPAICITADSVHAVVNQVDTTGLQYPVKFSGRVISDYDLDGYEDPYDVGVPNQMVRLIPDSIITWTDEFGAYSFDVNDDQLRQVEWVKQKDWNQTVTGSIDLSVLMINKGENDFHVYKTTDTALFLIDHVIKRTRCGFVVPSRLFYTNIGTVEGSAVLSYRPDPRSTLLSSIPPADFVNEGTYFWNVDQVEPQLTHHIYIEEQMPGVESIGTNLESEIAVVVDGELTSSVQNSSPITCAYDPNDKAVNPAGVYDEHYTLFNEPLRYKIRFQNTGNDTAFNIVVVDTISSFLDLSTLHILGTSHPMKLKSEPGGILKFQFENILLPDSNVNELGSHGFISFIIDPVWPMDENEKVENTAYIFFDFNPPIVTNTVFNTYVSTIPIILHEDYELGDSESTVVIYPHPVTESATLEFHNPDHESFNLYLYDAMGRLYWSKSNITDSSVVLSKDQHNTGVSLLRLVNQSHGEQIQGRIVFVD